jgi:hypothetical protein|tara:strand:+ start:381 stop:560 length:180 start_codon:yes stop_codon:yes gene_type:complete
MCQQIKKQHEELDDDGIPMPKDFELGLDVSELISIGKRMRERNQLAPLFKAWMEILNGK